LNSTVTFANALHVSTITLHDCIDTVTVAGHYVYRAAVRRGVAAACVCRTVRGSGRAGRLNATAERCVRLWYDGPTTEAPYADQCTSTCTGATHRGRPIRGQKKLKYVRVCSFVVFLLCSSASRAERTRPLGWPVNISRPRGAPRAGRGPGLQGVWPGGLGSGLHDIVAWVSLPSHCGDRGAPAPPAPAPLRCPAPVGACLRGDEETPAARRGCECEYILIF
jgi:hypothetical protein